MRCLGSCGLSDSLSGSVKEQRELLAVSELRFILASGCRKLAEQTGALHSWRACVFDSDSVTTIIVLRYWFPVVPLNCTGGYRDRWLGGRCEV